MPPDQVSPAFRAHCHYAAHCDPGRHEHVGKLFVRDTVAAHPRVGDLVQLVELLWAGADAGVLGWLAEHYPEHLRLVPDARRAAFLKGVYAGLGRLERAVGKALAAQEDVACAEKRSAQPCLHLLVPSLN